MLNDLGSKVNKSNARGIKSALVKFNAMLVAGHNQDPKEFPYKHFDQCTFEYLENHGESLLGYYGDFLFRYADVEWATAGKYLSAVKNAFRRKYKKLTIFQNPTWYQKLRRELTKIYFNDRVEKGLPIKTCAPRMEEKDLAILTDLMLKANSKEYNLNRCLMVLQWQLLGRIGELANIQYKHLSFHSKQKADYLVMQMNRVKTSLQQDIHMFVHANNYRLCPFHALACLIITNGSVQYLFKTMVKGSSIVTHMNNLLNNLYDIWNDPLLEKADNSDIDIQLKANLSSHSVRSGALNEANTNPDLLIQWLIQRGGWVVDGMQTIFNYLTGIIINIIAVNVVLINNVILCNRDI